MENCMNYFILIYHVQSELPCVARKKMLIMIIYNTPFESDSLWKQCHYRCKLP